MRTSILTNKSNCFCLSESEIVRRSVERTISGSDRSKTWHCLLSNFPNCLCLIRAEKKGFSPLESLSASVITVHCDRSDKIEWKGHTLGSLEPEQEVMRLEFYQPQTLTKNHFLEDKSMQEVDQGIGIPDHESAKAYSALLPIKPLATKNGNPQNSWKSTMLN